MFVLSKPLLPSEPCAKWSLNPVCSSASHSIHMYMYMYSNFPPLRAFCKQTPLIFQNSVEPSMSSHSYIYIIGWIIIVLLLGRILDARMCLRILKWFPGLTTPSDDTVPPYEGSHKIAELPESRISTNVPSFRWIGIQVCLSRHIRVQMYMYLPLG